LINAQKKEVLLTLKNFYKYMNKTKASLINLTLHSTILFFNLSNADSVFNSEIHRYWG
jgi:hypothetical protein